jgi:hypothetical protein
MGARPCFSARRREQDRSGSVGCRLTKKTEPQNHLQEKADRPERSQTGPCGQIPDGPHRRRGLPARQRHHSCVVDQKIQRLPGMHPLREIGDRREVGQIETLVACPSAGHFTADFLDRRMPLPIVAAGQNDLCAGLGQRQGGLVTETAVAPVTTADLPSCEGISACAETGMKDPCSGDQITSQQAYFRIKGIWRLVGRFWSVSKPRPSILRAPQNSRSPLR